MAFDVSNPVYRITQAVSKASLIVTEREKSILTDHFIGSLNIVCCDDACVCHLLFFFTIF